MRLKNMRYLIIILALLVLMSCSSSGNKIAFVSGPELYSDFTHIHVVNSDGTGEVALTNGDSKNSSPCWSPEARKSLLLLRVMGVKKFT